MRNTIKVNNHRLISRSDLAAIADMIPHGAKILDLGCGSGRLLKALKMLKDAKIMGVELDQGKIIECVRRGVPVIQSNLDGALPEFMAPRSSACGDAPHRQQGDHQSDEFCTL